MATIICSSCGTRNPPETESCRRCDEPIGAAPTPATLPPAPRDPTQNIMPTMVAGRWAVGEHLAGSDNPYLYLGRDAERDQTVLIKKLSREAALDRTLRGRFSREAEILGGLDHPGVAKLLEVVVDNDMPAMILEARGQATLRMLLDRKRRVPVAIALECINQLLDIFEYLHNNRVTHRQLMPTKILVGVSANTGLAQFSIVDFGLADRVEVMSLDDLEYGGGTLMGVKATDSLSGSSPIPYQAPEQLRGDSDKQSDIYSLGVIFFELLTGELPLSINPDDDASSEQSILHEEPTDVRLLRPEISPELESMISTMLSKDPAYRFQTVPEVREVLLTSPEAKSQTMVPVQKGDFLRGSRTDDQTSRPEEQPQAKVFLDAYFIDQAPVTAADYQLYLDATGTQPDPQWHKFNDPKNAPLKPVVYIDWSEASAYAKWAGKRLPTEAQWEKAARGTDGRAYPWGNDAPNDKRACFDQKSPCEVGAHPFGSSPWGVHEMAGNVFEWVEDWYSADYYKEGATRNPPGAETGTKKVIRGGSFAHGEFALRCASRGRYAPDARRANHGFRCAWSLHTEGLNPNDKTSNGADSDSDAEIIRQTLPMHPDSNS